MLSYTWVGSDHWFSSDETLVDGTVRYLKGRLFYSESSGMITLWYPIGAWSDEQRTSFGESF